MSELEENQLLGQMDNKQLKAKVKSIKDVYRTELNKIEKSKRVDVVNDVYVPKLTWFNEACFLSEVLAAKCILWHIVAWGSLSQPVMQTASSQNNSIDGVGFSAQLLLRTLRKRQASMPKAFSETLLARDVR
ncbi:hypothetical protein TNCV_3346911 [Trichonephila clavipes]|nr:hypothetical protein TNCV_3346911 [Trichonephila clavipes]